MVGRRWGRECSCWLKHLKAQRGLTLPLGSGGVNMRIADEDLKTMVMMIKKTKMGMVKVMPKGKISRRML